MDATKRNWIIGGVVAGTVALIGCAGCGGVVAFLATRPTHKTITHKNVTIDYWKPVTDAQAEAVKDYLFKFDPNPAMHMRLKRPSRTTEIYMMVKKGLDTDQLYISSTRIAIRGISQSAFGGEPCELHMCDENWKVLRVVTT